MGLHFFDLAEGIDETFETDIVRKTIFAIVLIGYVRDTGETNYSDTVMPSDSFSGIKTTISLVESLHFMTKKHPTHIKKKRTDSRLAVAVSSIA